MKALKLFLILAALCALYVFNGPISEEIRKFRRSFVANAVEVEAPLPPREQREVIGVDLLSEEELRAVVRDVGEDERIPAAVLEALIDAESGWEQMAFRMEPHLRGKVKHGDAGACSYGLTQVVYGYHAEACGLRSPVDLYDPEVSVRCAAKVLRDCWSRATGGNKERLRQSLRCYNGSGEKAEGYSKKVLAAVEEQLFRDVTL